MNIEPNQHKITLYEEMITKQLEVEVSNAIHDFVTDHIDTIVSELAAETVKKWSTSMYMQKEPGYDQKTNIQINFVENIIQTVMKDHDISITVNNKE